MVLVISCMFVCFCWWEHTKVWGGNTPQFWIEIYKFWVGAYHSLGWEYYEHTKQEYTQTGLAKYQIRRCHHSAREHTIESEHIIGWEHVTVWKRTYHLRWNHTTLPDRSIPQFGVQTHKSRTNHSLVWEHTTA